MAPSKQSRGGLQAKQSTAVDANSRLLELPAELRLYTWKAATTSTKPSDVSSARGFPKEPPLLKTCKQICHEAWQFFYAQNTFLYSFVIPKLERRTEDTSTTVAIAGSVKHQTSLRTIGLRKAGTIRTFEIHVSARGPWVKFKRAYDVLGEEDFIERAKLGFIGTLEHYLEVGVAIDAIGTTRWEPTHGKDSTMADFMLGVMYKAAEASISQLKQDPEVMYWDIRRLWSVEG